MSKIEIDNIEYDFDAFSDEIKAQIISMKFVDAEIQRLQAKLAAMQTARSAYARAVQEGLNASVKAIPIANFETDSIQFN